MGLGPGSSIQVNIEVLNNLRIPPAHKASIHSTQGLLLLAEVPLGEPGEATVAYCQ